MAEFILVVPEFYTPNTEASAHSVSGSHVLCALVQHTDPLNTHLYLAHALKEPEGNLCQRRKKPFPF